MCRHAGFVKNPKTAPLLRKRDFLAYKA